MNKTKRGDEYMRVDSLPPSSLCDSMTLEDAQKMYKTMEKEILLRKYNLPTKPSSDGYYHVNVKDLTTKSGRRQLKSKTLDDLKDKLYEYEKGLNGDSRKTFSDVFKIVQSEKLKYIKDDEKKLSAKNTLWRKQEDYKRFFLDTSFEKMFIEDIGKKDIEEICMYNLQRYNLKMKAFLALRGILKETFTMAFEEYWITDNVYNRVNFKKFNNMIERPTPITERVHTEEEMVKIRTFLDDKHYASPNYLPAYALDLQILMGLRRGEVPPLKWSDIQDGYILISREQITIKDDNPKHKNYVDVVVNHTKTWKNRKFPITKELDELLKAIRLVHVRTKVNSEYIFPSDNKNGIISNNVVYKFYQRMCKALDIPLCNEFKKGTHSFRRNAITDTINKSGGDIFMTSQLYGNTPKIAEDHYYVGLDLDKAKAVLEA